MTDRDKFEAWWFAAPEGGASYEQVYGRSYREVAFLAWGMAAEEAVRLDRERTDAQIVGLGVLAMRGVAPEKPPKKIVDAICDWFDRNLMGCSDKDAAALYSIAHGRVPTERQP